MLLGLCIIASYQLILSGDERKTEYEIGRKKYPVLRLIYQFKRKNGKKLSHHPLKIFQIIAKSDKITLN